MLVRHRAVTIGALVTLTLLAWLWLLAGAGMGMDPLVSLSPPATMSPHGAAMGDPMPGAAGSVALILAMWWIMMVAMMLPAAAPTILLYARVSSQASAAAPATFSFLAGYLAAWGGFSLGATMLQLLLARAELFAAMPMASQSRWLSASILVAAGFYQLAPLKDMCLRHCRSPAQFLSVHYRAGRWGALRMGLLHGAYCVGCCWLLMALLFVGGVMNLAWIALLTLMVAAEKLLPFGRRVAVGSGIACLVWGGIILLG